MRSCPIKHGTTLVIGGDSTIGGALKASFEADGKSVWVTTRHPTRGGERRIYLDLSKDVLHWRLPRDFDTAFLCAAVTSMEHCRLEPKATRRINVDHTIAIARRLVDNGVFVVFPSTNFVFDGETPSAKTSDPVNPKTEYGRQKAEAEKQLLGLGNQVGIVRLGKVIAPDMPLFQGWMQHLKEGKTIHPFSDMVLSPVSIDFLLHILIEIALRKKYGIWHVSAKNDITYEDIARHLSMKIGVSQKSIQPIKSRDSGLIFETIPKYTTLDSSRIEDELGIKPPDAFNAINSGLSPNSSVTCKSVGMK